MPFPRLFWTIFLFFYQCGFSCRRSCGKQFKAPVIHDVVYPQLAMEHHTATHSCPHQQDWGEPWKAKVKNLMSWDKDRLVGKHLTHKQSKAKQIKELIHCCQWADRCSTTPRRVMVTWAEKCCHSKCPAFLLLLPALWSEHDAVQCGMSLMWVPAWSRPGSWCSSSLPTGRQRDLLQRPSCWVYAAQQEHKHLYIMHIFRSTNANIALY